MELRLGPFDPVLHVRSRDHYEAVRREAQLMELGSREATPDLDELLEDMAKQFGVPPIDHAADRAYLAGERSVEVTMTVPDERVGALLRACDELERLLDELDRWTEASGDDFLEAPGDVKRYRRAYIDQIRSQLGASHSSA
jgi:HEAT repeat protein